MNTPIPHKSNICAVIITYHPDKNLPQRISKILPQVNKIILVDNNSNPDSKEMLHALARQDNIALIENNQNLGIATALNRGIDWANKHAYKWALTFDQDTTPEASMVDTLINVFEAVNENDKIAVIGANYIVNDSGQPLLDYQKMTNKIWVERKTLITSGGLTSLEVYNKIGPFRDEFFIDSVDHEYCLRARAKKYKIIIALQPLMNHCIGEDAAIHIPLLNLHTFDHSPFRRYYMTRNAIILVREYLFKDPAWAILRLIRVFGSIILMFFFKSNKLKKLKYVSLGMWDALTFNTKRHINTDNT